MYSPSKHYDRPELRKSYWAFCVALLLLLLSSALWSQDSSRISGSPQLKPPRTRSSFCMPVGRVIRSMVQAGRLAILMEPEGASSRTIG